VVEPTGIDPTGNRRIPRQEWRFVRSAQYGHSAGAVVNATIKSGTNRFHGTVFEFIRNDKVDARNFLLLPTDPTPELRRNIYGGTIGGPVIRNKTFFFLSWQGTRQNSGAATIVETVESPAFRAGDFSSLKTAINDPTLTVPNDAGPGFVKTAMSPARLPCSNCDQFDQRSINHWFDTTAFTIPTQYNYGNSGRDIVYSPGAVNFDCSLFKRYSLRKLGDAGQVQLRFEGFNIFNHPQFGQPNADLQNAQIRTIIFLTNTMRQLHAGLKIIF
jgi:hypothetical protein